MGVEKDANGDIYLTGDFGGNAIFGTYNVNSYKTVDMFIAKYNINGSCLGLIHFGGAEPSDIFTGSLNIASNTDLIVSGNFKDTISVGNTDLMSNGNNAMFFARTTAISGLKELNPVDNNLLIIYANPTTGKCNITVPDEFLNEKNLTLSIFNTNGQLIQQKKLEMNDGKIKLNLEEEAKGIYNVTLSDGKKVYSGKIVFE